MTATTAWNIVANEREHKGLISTYRAAFDGLIGYLDPPTTGLLRELHHQSFLCYLAGKVEVNVKRHNLPRRRIQYAEEKFSNAVEYLAVGLGDLRERLCWAYLECQRISSQDLPNSVRRDWRWVKRRLEKTPPRWTMRASGSRRLIKGSFVHIRNRTGSKIAQRILKIAKALERAA